MTAESLAALLGQIATAGLLPLAAWLLAMLRRAKINDTVLKAVARGAGAAYMSLLEDRDRGVTPGTIAKAVDDGAAYVEERVTGTLTKAGVDTDAVRSLVRAELGKLLAADPSVKVG
jgi:hypothetical protein